jgi:hypothetical protein
MKNLSLIQKILVSILVVGIVSVGVLFSNNGELSKKIINYIYLDEFTTVEYLSKHATKFNEMLPVDIDDNIRINNSSAKDSNLIFNITLKNLDTNQEKDIYLEKIKRYFTVKEIDSIKEKTCKNKNFNTLISAGNKITNSYYSNDKIHILSVVIKEKDCKKIN